MWELTTRTVKAKLKYFDFKTERRVITPTSNFYNKIYLNQRRHKYVLAQVITLKWDRKKEDKKNDHTNLIKKLNEKICGRRMG